MLHNKIITCSSCNKIAHGKCEKSTFEFSNVENSWICFDCASNESKKYNVFSMSCFDKHDPKNLHHVEELHQLSKILNNCEKYDVKKFNKLSKSINTAGKIVFPVSAITLMTMLQILINLKLRYLVNIKIYSPLLPLLKLILILAIKTFISYLATLRNTVKNFQENLKEAVLGFMFKISFYLVVIRNFRVVLKI